MNRLRSEREAGVNKIREVPDFDYPPAISQMDSTFRSWCVAACGRACRGGRCGFSRVRRVVTGMDAIGLSVIVRDAVAPHVYQTPG